MGWNPFRRTDAADDANAVSDRKTHRHAEKASRAVAKSAERDLKRVEARYARRLDASGLPPPAFAAHDLRSPASAPAPASASAAAPVPASPDDLYPTSFPPLPPPMPDLHPGASTRWGASASSPALLPQGEALAMPAHPPSLQPALNHRSGMFTPGQVVPGTILPAATLPSRMSARSPIDAHSSLPSYPPAFPTSGNAAGVGAAAHRDSTPGPAAPRTGSRRNSAFLDYVRGRSTSNGGSDYQSRWDPARRASTYTSGGSLPALDFGRPLSTEPVPQRPDGTRMDRNASGSISAPGQPSTPFRAASSPLHQSAGSENSQELQAEITSLRQNIAKLRRTSQDLESLMSGAKLSDMGSPPADNRAREVGDPVSLAATLSPVPHRPGESSVFSPGATRPPAGPAQLFSPPPADDRAGAGETAPTLPAIPAAPSLLPDRIAAASQPASAPVAPATMPAFITPTAGPGTQAFQRPVPTYTNPTRPPASTEGDGEDGVLGSVDTTPAPSTEHHGPSAVPPQLDRPSKDWFAGDNYTPFPSEGRDQRQMKKYLLASDSVEEAKAKSRAAGRLALYPDEAALQQMDADLHRQGNKAEVAELSPEEERARLEKYRPHYQADDVNPWSGVPRRAQQRGQERDARRAAAVAATNGAATPRHPPGMATPEAATPRHSGMINPGAVTPFPGGGTPSMYGTPGGFATPGGLMTPGGMGTPGYATPGGMMTPGMMTPGGMMGSGMMSPPPGMVGGVMTPTGFMPMPYSPMKKERSKTIAQLEDRHKERLAAMQAGAKVNMEKARLLQLERQKVALAQEEKEKAARAMEQQAKHPAKEKEKDKTKDKKASGSDPRWRQSAVSLLHLSNSTPRASKSFDRKSAAPRTDGGKTRPSPEPPGVPSPAPAHNQDPPLDNKGTNRMSTMSFATPGAPQPTPRASMYGFPGLMNLPSTTQTPRQSTYLAGGGGDSGQSTYSAAVLGDNPTPRQNVYASASASPDRPGLVASQSTPAVLQSKPAVVPAPIPKAKRELTDTDLRRKAEMRGSQPLLSFEGPLLQEARGRAQEAKTQHQRISMQLLNHY